MKSAEMSQKGMPNDLVLVRHGFSEANKAQKTKVKGDSELQVMARADWEQRLTPQGVEQAKLAGSWLAREFGMSVDETFDLKYVSQFIRTTETAQHLGGQACTGWLYDKRVVERSWGIFGAASREEQKEAFVRTVTREEIDPLYTAKDGGEALATDVLIRWRDFLDTLHREATGKRVLVVTHGELMWVARFDLERMLPEEWVALDVDKTQKIRNCSILHYTRVNPEDPSEVSRRLQWMRFVYPDAVDESPYGGQWREIQNNRRHTGVDLAARVNKFPRLLEN